MSDKVLVLKTNKEGLLLNNKKSNSHNLKQKGLKYIFFKENSFAISQNVDRRIGRYPVILLLYIHTK